jgi:chorismate mutase / prephenate dehydratase
MSSSLADLRLSIDAVDSELLGLLNRRAMLAEAVGEVKKLEGTPFFRPDRVASVIAALQGKNKGPLKSEHIGAIWNEIMSACLALEAPVKVAYLGPAGTFSEQAALQYFGSSIEHVPCSSIDEVFRATASGGAAFGVIPVENSSEGVVARSLDLFLNSPLHIIGETSLMVRHNLLRLTDGTDGIHAIYAHPQALAQCHAWLATHLPNAEQHAASSNAEGARLASTNSAWAAIASERAGQQFGLHSPAQGIQDDAFNRTRFAIVCLPQSLPKSAQPTLSPGKDCISLVVSVTNRPGAVHDILAPLKKHGVSMTRFESRPARSGQWEYYFYIDLQGHLSQGHVAAALLELQQLCAFYKILGSYPISNE